MCCVSVCCVRTNRYKCSAPIVLYVASCQQHDLWSACRGTNIGNAILC